MPKRKEYRYVGPASILASLPIPSQRIQVTSAHDVQQWIESTRQPTENDGSVVATFIVDTSGVLWVSDRRSEHVLCAAGQNVLSAGEMSFVNDKPHVYVESVTNQSTGYCPEPESWPIVAMALTDSQIEHPAFFTTAFIFRRCSVCQTTNIVKDLWFECAVCGATLSLHWNFDTTDEET